MTRKLLLISLLFSTSVAYAQSDRSIDVTVYAQDLAMVKEVRQLKTRQGTAASLITFSDLPSQLDPSSISISPISCLQQSYEYDLSDFSKLLEGYVNGTVSVSLQSGKVFEGCLLGFDQQWIFLRDKDRVKLLAISDICDISCQDQRDGLLTTPTLVCTLAGDKPLPQQITIRYLTSGISWKCDYTAVLSDTDLAMELSAKATINNQSGGKFPQARIKLVAGNPYRIQNMPSQRYGMRKMAMAAAPLAEAEEQYESREEIGEYYLYTMKNPATLNNNQTTQVDFLSQMHVPVKKKFSYDYTKSAKNARLILSFKNEKQGGLGIPLPKGKIRCYKQDEEDFLQFIGENIIEHTPVDDKIVLCLGDVFDITARRETKDRRVLSKERVEEDYEVRIKNSKKEKVSVEVVEHAWGSWEVIKSTHKYVKKTADTLVFEIEIAPDKKETLLYTVAYRR
ncbi:MAG: DUF4139 domain-containing protein [bacterium]|nr:DUF4139 domain-containing protein [bacterium]